MRGNLRFGDMIDHHGEPRYAPGQFRNQRQVLGAQKQVVRNFPAGQFGQTVENIRAKQPSDIRFVMNDMPDTDKAGVFLALVERIANLRVREVDPGNNSFYEGKLRGEFEQPPRLADVGIRLDDNRAVESMPLKDGRKVIREIVPAQYVVAGRHPGVGQASHVPEVLVCVYSHGNHRSGPGGTRYNSGLIVKSPVLPCLRTAAAPFRYQWPPRACS